MADSMGEVFQGTSVLAMDAKGRTAVPTRFREALAAQCGGQLTLVKSPEGCLKLYPQPIWLELRTRLLALPQDAAAWRRFLLGSAQDIELDGAGRFLIAPELRGFAKLQRDLKFMGVGSHFELWDAQVHADHEAATMASAMPASIADLNF